MSESKVKQKIPEERLVFSALWKVLALHSPLSSVSVLTLEIFWWLLSTAENDTAISSLDDLFHVVCALSLFYFLSFVVFSASGIFTHLGHCFHTFGFQTLGCCFIWSQRMNRKESRLKGHHPFPNWIITVFLWLCHTTEKCMTFIWRNINSETAIFSSFKCPQ